MKSFECMRCGNCCRWSGCVKVGGDEVDMIAAFLKLTPEAFLAQETELMPDRTGLTLREKSDGSCRFLVTGSDGLAACAIECVKPAQCRNFPEKWNFPGWEQECGGRKK